MAKPRWYLGHMNKNIVVIGRTNEGFLVKTGDTMLEIVEYAYEGRIRIGDRLSNHGKSIYHCRGGSKPQRQY